MCESDDTGYVSTNQLQISAMNDLNEAKYALSRQDYLTMIRWLTEAKLTAEVLLKRAHVKRVK